MWIKVDDKLANHPKVYKAGALLGRDGAAIALGMFHWGLSYAAEYLTDGAIPRAAVAHCRHVARPLTIADVLVTAGLWESRDGDYQIHDYHDWNPTAEEVRNFKELKAQSGRVGGLRSGQARKQTTKQTGSEREAPASILLQENEANGQANAKQNPSSRARDPDPQPVQLPTEAGTAPAGPEPSLRPVEPVENSGGPNGHGKTFRRICAIVQRCLREHGPYDYEADLREDVKRLCAQQGLRLAHSGLVTKAMNSVQALSRRGPPGAACEDEEARDGERAR